VFRDVNIPHSAVQ